MPIKDELKNLGRPAKVLLLGSGGLSIGQAGEFDYSGSQAVKALLEEGLEVIIVNPNIATVQTNPKPHTKVYLYPVTPDWVEKVIIEENPDAIMAGFGGQTALNCLLALEERGTLERYNIINLGTSCDTLRLTEDRDLFAKKMLEIDIPIPKSIACDSLGDAFRAADEIQYPVIVRAAYALGGLGSGFASDAEELKALVEPALSVSPQVLIEKSLKGWKEIEYEVMRDAEGNTITICNMENFDPLGIHTGDSIVVCPSQSLSDDEYQLLRDASLRIVKSLGVIGECNVQLALDPLSKEFYVIEVNARLSRSSALASKASGYPIAYIAAKVVCGYDLLELKNPVTGVTFSYFEPALDYVTVKIPRWDLKKFKGVSRLLGSTMKSVGEVMSIGRSFPEALQKAVRMVTERGTGLGVDMHKGIDENEVINDLANPSDTRLYSVIMALRIGKSIDQIHELTKIDKWFIFQLKEIIDCEKRILSLIGNTEVEASGNELVEAVCKKVLPEQWREWKCLGFGDEQIAALILHSKHPRAKLSDQKTLTTSLIVRKYRTACGVVPYIKMIDTTAGEYPANSNYLYLSYHGNFHDNLYSKAEDSKAYMILGGGAYRVGTSVEFDWCAVSSAQKLTGTGNRSIMVNCNPETVSTDYNSSDSLYFEELTFERIVDIYELENATGVIACMGGQLPNRLARDLHGYGLNLLGHSAATIELAENREKFSQLLDELEIDQPKWTSATSRAQIDSFVEKVGFPVLVRPSFVLSGAAMKVAYDRPSLDLALSSAADISVDYPVVISDFIMGAREIELDGVAKDGEILTAIVSEHIENAGVHSGDATTVVPAQNLYVETVRRVRRAGRKIAKGLKLNGPFNIQFLARSNHIKVIECNARAARSFPFVSKVVGLNLAGTATEVIMGLSPKCQRFSEEDLPYVGVKAPMFSFTRLSGADPVLGVEMASTGEVGCIGHSVDEAMILSMQASNIQIPRKGVLVSAGREEEKIKFLKCIDYILDKNIPIYASPGTAEFLQSHNIKATSLNWPGEGGEDVLQVIEQGLVDFVINIPKNLEASQISFGQKIRQKAVQYGCSLLTNMEKVSAFLNALALEKDFEKSHKPIRLSEFCDL